MFEQNAIIKSPALADAWLWAVVDAYGTSDEVPYPDDCAEIVRHFERVGVSITISDADSFWSAHSRNLAAGWLTLAQDCVAALDWLAEDIELGVCQVESLKQLRGAVKVDS